MSRQKDYVLRRYGVLGKLSRWAFSRRRTILDTGQNDPVINKTSRKMGVWNLLTFQK